MAATISSLEDTASIFYRGRAVASDFADNVRMVMNAWRKRLEEAVDGSGKSRRSISLESGCAAGYVHSILVEGKDPTIEKLIAVCETIKANPAFILYGVDVTKEDAEIIDLIRSNPEARNAILSILRAKSSA